MADALATKINGKADAATTLAGYGITDAYTKTETDTHISNALNYTPVTGKFLDSVGSVSTVDSAITALDAGVYGITSQISAVTTQIGNAVSAVISAGDVVTSQTPDVAYTGSMIDKGMAFAKNLWIHKRNFYSIITGLDYNTNNAVLQDATGATYNIMNIVDNYKNWMPVLNNVSKKEGATKTLADYEIAGAQTLVGSLDVTNDEASKTTSITPDTVKTATVSAADITATGNVATPKLTLNSKELTSVDVVETDTDNSKIVATKASVARDISNLDKTLSEKIDNIDGTEHTWTNNNTFEKKVTFKDGIDVTGTVQATAVQTSNLTIGNNKVTDINTGAVVTGDGSGSVLATTATVMASAENAKFTAPTGDEAVQSIGNASTIHNAIVNVGKGVDAVDEKVNTLATNIVQRMGGKFDENGAWSARIENDKEAPKDGYYSAFDAENLADAISTVYSTIGTDEALSEVKFNGVSADQTVNENIAAINDTIGDIEGLNTDLKNLTNGTKVAPETVVEALNNIDATLGTIHGLADKRGGDYKGNLASGTTVEMHLTALDDAIGDRTTITNEKGSNGYQFSTDTMYVADVLSDLASQIGTAEELSDTTIEGISADQTVNQNIAALNNVIGDVSELVETAYAQGDSMVDAIKGVDSKLGELDGRLTKTEKDLKELHHDFRRGMASMAAMSALVPNSRSTGKTSLSLGTGAYGGHGAVAVGGFHYITDNLMLNAGVSWSDSSDAAYRMGVTYSF